MNRMLKYGHISSANKDIRSIIPTFRRRGSTAPIPCYNNINNYRYCAQLNNQLKEVLLHISYRNNLNEIIRLSLLIIYSLLIHHSPHIYIQI